MGTANNSTRVFAYDCSHFMSNSLVTYSPDHTAFTIGYGDRSAEMYSYSDYGYRISIFGIEGLPDLEIGEHYYDGLVVGETKVGYWEMLHPIGRCIHSAVSNCSVSALNAMGANKSNCHRIYNAGWVSFCASCGRKCTPVLFYMTAQMACKTAYLPSGTEFSNYFYLCPYDNSLENYCSTDHICRLISANRYKVVYNSNDSSATGSMDAEWYTYDNEGMYEGEEIEWKETISKCRYTIKGKRFVGWSNRPNGEVLFSDEELWINVQNELNVGEKENEERIILYAVWEKDDDTESPNDGPRDKVPKELVLNARIIRTLKEKDSREEFIRGESGTLYFEVTGGADYVVVDFPKGMEAYSTVFDYSQKIENIKSEEIFFSIPLEGIPDETDCLIVRVVAYKDNIVVDDYPEIILICCHSILDEIRTSLR